MLSWKDGSINEQSLRVKTPIKKHFEKYEETTINECLENNIMLDVINKPIFSRYEENESNKREYNFEKMNEREMYGQKNMNPYLSGNNYVNDIDNSNNFLMYKKSKVIE